MGEENVLKLDGGDGWTILSTLKTTEWYILKGWILWCINDISIKLLLNKRLWREVDRVLDMGVERGEEAMINSVDLILKAMRDTKDFKQY